MAHLISEDFAVQSLDARIHIGFVGEQFDTDTAQFVEHDAARHLACSHERDTNSLGDEDVES